MSEMENTVGKATDMIGGMAGKMGAKFTTDADGFVENAAIGDLYEIEAARIALRRCERDDIRGLAAKMIVDHTTSTHQLQSALEMNETKGVRTPPMELDTRRRTMIEHLEDAPADAFDKTYLDQQVLAHQETVSLLTTYRDGGDNPQLRSVAAGCAPVVQRHLAMVEQLRANA